MSRLVNANLCAGTIAVCAGLPVNPATSKGSDRMLTRLKRTSPIAIPKRWTRPHWRILCYHAIEAKSIVAFRSQLQQFLDLGYSFVSLDVGLQACSADRLESPILTVTLDDGDATIHKNVLPVLEALRVTACLYVVSDYIAKGVTYRDDRPRPALCRRQLQDWVDAGHGVGAHTVTHAPLTLCNDERLQWEMDASKAQLEDWLQVPIVHFSYPWGQHSPRTYAMLKRHNVFASAATIDRGMMFGGHDPLRLRRDVCSPEMAPARMLRTMRLADRWYWMRGLRLKGRGYWDHHPEERWDRLPEERTR